MICAYCGHEAGPYLAGVQGLPVCHSEQLDDCYRRAYLDNDFMDWARKAKAGDPEWGAWRDEEDS